MKLFNILILIFPITLFTEEIVYKEGDSFESIRSHSVVLYAYKADARRVNNALQFSFNAQEFMKYAAVDSRDIYKVKRGDAFVLTESIKDGDIFKVKLTSKRINNEKYFILSKDLKDNSLSQLETGT
tara:strand:- start:811 stop:1191 length:381 start_codon:yes stop_codon:yes gene_type:complete